MILWLESTYQIIWRNFFHINALFSLDQSVTSTSETADQSDLSIMSHLCTEHTESKPHPIVLACIAVDSDSLSPSPSLPPLKKTLPLSVFLLTLNLAFLRYFFEPFFFLLFFFFCWWRCVHDDEVILHFFNFCSLVVLVEIVIMRFGWSRIMYQLKSWCISP